MADTLTYEKIKTLRKSKEIKDLYNKMLIENAEFKQFANDTKDMTSAEILAIYDVNIPMAYLTILGRENIQV